MFRKHLSHKVGWTGCIPHDTCKRNNLHMTIKKIIFLTLLLCITDIVFGQKTQTYLDKDILFKNGLELFDKKQFTAAQKSFLDYIQSNPNNRLSKTEAQFYQAICAVELFHKDGEWELKQFTEQHPESNKIKTAYFYLGKSNFRKKKYDETIKFLEKVDIYELSKIDLAELYFKRGYSYFIENNNEKAKLDLFEIKDVDNKYESPANYYYSHIAYLEKHYETALSGFRKLLSDDTFGPIVPYYITQIYYIQGKFNEVIKNAPALLNDSSNVQKESEINRMIAESYFNLKDYNNALTYFKKSVAEGGFNAQGNYELGYCYYQIKDYLNAILYFEKSTEKKDSLAQNAWYHLADCHIQTGNKNKARMAFYAAAMLDFDDDIKENALYSYAKLCYELSFAPYDDAVLAFQKYIKTYQNSPKKTEAYTFLVNVYSTTKNYGQAIASIEKIKPLDPILKITYQKLIYFQGVEYFNNSNIDSAFKYFKKSLSINFNQTYNALSLYWLGEISYLKKDYNAAIDHWKAFQITEGSYGLKEYDLSNYNIGYAYFQLKNKKDYENANISFRKFLLTKNKYDATKIADATVRTADTYFMNNIYLQASENYQTAINLNTIDVDYSMYQKALCDGILKKYTEKIELLKTLINKYPKSNYFSAATFEAAETYRKNLNDDENALSYYEKIIDKFPNSSYVNPSLAGIGLIYYNKSNDDKAFEYFDKIVKIDPKSSESKEALEYIKKIFEGKKDIAGLENYFKEIGNPLNTNVLESSLFEAAREAYYNEKNYDLAMQKFETYISKYPEGKYISEAHYCYAECAYSKGLFDKALPSYQYLNAKSRSIYSETALSKSSYILYKNKKYDEALPLYKSLEEMADIPSNKLAGSIGAMRCAFETKNYELVITEAGRVLLSDKITPQQNNEAKYLRAKSLFEIQRFDEALTEFKAIFKNSKNITGAEALYHIAKIQYEKQDYTQVEKTINNLMSYNYSNDDWNTKGLLLLSDAYIAKGDDVDAELMLQTIIDAKQKQEYLDEATKKLEQIKAKKNLKLNNESSNNSKDMKVEFNSGNQEKDLFDKLFEEQQNKLNSEKKDN